MSNKECADYRAFRGIWIPAEVWLSQDMTLQEKVMLVEINSLQHPDRGCFKSNRALADFFQLSISRVSEIIASLDRKGLVRVELIRDGRQVIERRIFMSTPFGIPNTPSGNAMTPFGKGDEPPSGKAKESNTSLSNTVEVEETRVRAPACPDGVSASVWRDFLAVRKAKRAPITEIAMHGIIREAGKAGITLEQAMTVCIERSWQGFRADWYVEQRQDKNSPYADRWVV
jgi:hypothetical protein